MQNFFFNASGQIPPGLTKKTSPPLTQANPQTQVFQQQNQTPSSLQDQNLPQQNTLERLNQFLSDPVMRQLLKDIINQTNVKKKFNFIDMYGVFNYY